MHTHTHQRLVSYSQDSQLLCLKPMTDERQNRLILLADFIGPHKIGRLFVVTRLI